MFVRVRDMKKLLPRIIGGAAALTPFGAAAQEFIPSTNNPQLPPSGALITLVNQLARYAVGLIILIAVAYILYAAWIYLTSQGKEDSLTQAKNILLYSVVAIGVALLASAIVRLVVQVFSGFGY